MMSSHCQFEDEVDRNMKKLMVLLKNAVSLTEREMALLSVAITEMCQAGLDPYNERFVVQIDFWMQWYLIGESI